MSDLHASAVGRFVFEFFSLSRFDDWPHDYQRSNLLEGGGADTLL